MMKRNTHKLAVLLLLFIIGCNEDNFVDPPPSATFSFEIDESFRGGTEIGDISVEDPTGLDIVYTLLENESSYFFDVDEATGKLSVAEGALLQYNQDEVVELLVEADNGESKKPATLTVNVTVIDLPFDFEKYSYIEPISSEVVGTKGWVEYDFAEEDCKCFNEDPFRAAVNDQGSGENLIITLQGGGACWGGFGGCEDIFTQILGAYIQVANFSLALADSLEGTWDHVLIPYCDKSVYTGDRSIDYDGDGDMNHFWGFRNSSAGINLAVENFPNANRIILTGCSAGGYGTIANAALVRHYYPEAEIYVINESGPGIFNPVDAATYSTIRDQWSLTPPEGCTTCDTELISWYDHMMAIDDKLKVAQFSSLEDDVLQWFLSMNRTELRNHLLSSSGSLNTKYPDRYKRFFIDGDKHCFSNVADRNLAIGETRYWQWVQDFINEDAGWEDLIEE